MFLFCAPTKLKITFLFLNQKLPEVVEFLRYFAALFAHQGKQILRLTPSPVSSTKNKKQESWNNPPKFWDLNDAWLKDHHVDIRRRKKVIEPQRQNCQRDMFVFLLSFPLLLMYSQMKTQRVMIISYSWSGGCCKGAEQKLDHQHSSLRSSTTPLFETFPNEKGSHMICAKLMRKQASLATKQLKFGQKGIKMSSHCQQDAV